MNQYEEDFKLETEYLNHTLEVLKNNLKKEKLSIAKKGNDLVAARRDMYKNTAHGCIKYLRYKKMND